MKYAFFDFDGTLTRHDSFMRFAKFCVGKRKFFKALIKSLPMIVLWKAGLKSNSEAKQELFSNLFKGMPYKQFRENGKLFAAEIDKDTRHDIMEILKQHQKNGVDVFIVSASMEDWIRPWAELKGIRNVIGTQVEIDENEKLSGRFGSKNCHGKEKVLRIKSLIPDINLYESWAYGDSSGDDEMLVLATHPNRVK